jgi:(E)-2-((N-methylformamido)methylene)succinate hydrolase
MPFARSQHAGRLHYAERGERRENVPSVLLVHGAGASSAIWMMAMARLARAAHVVAIDLPGHGPSPLPEGGVAALSLEGYRDAAGALAASLCLGPSVLVGHSMGALVAMEAALAWPDKVRGLVLCAAAPRLPVRDELLALLRADHARFPAWMAEHGLSPRAKPGVRRAFAAAGIVTSRDTTLADFETVRAADLGARVAGLTCPVLWLDGADDQIVAPTEGRPGDVRRLEGVGHMVPIEAPEAVTEGVAAIVAMGQASGK